MEIVSLKHIYKKYNDKIIFDNYSLDINEGEFVSIMGESGKGKTTLLNIIGLLEIPDKGDINICGIENPRFNRKSGIKLLRNNISYLFQDYGLISSETVKYNLMLSIYFQKLNKKEKNEKIHKTLMDVGLKDFEEKKVYQLSGGEQQRVALAKIILKNSKLILADEPTGSLDVHNRDIVLNILSELNKNGKTIIVVTHDLAVEKCAKINLKL